ncbi:recombinase RecT [Faecalibacterium prausnitzii]
MATTNTLKNQLANKQQNKPIQEGYTIKQLMKSDNVKKRFEDVLGNKAPQFMTSVINLVNGDTNLRKVDQMSVIASAMVAASLDLPVDKNLGYSWIIPYGNKAQFQLGYKGYIQLALRTGQYKHINVIEVYEGELQKWDRLTEVFEIDFDEKKSDAVVGYAAYFELINGFKKTVYWTKEEVEKHRKRFSKSDFGWKRDWDAMAKKTVLKNMLSKWGILSIEMQKAFIEDNEEREIKDVTEEATVIDGDFEIVDDEPSEQHAESEQTEQTEVIFDDVQ